MTCERKSEKREIKANKPFKSHSLKLATEIHIGRSVKVM